MELQIKTFAHFVEGYAALKTLLYSPISIRYMRRLRLRDMPAISTDLDQVSVSTMAVMTHFLSLPVELRIQIYELAFSRCRSDLAHHMSFLTSTTARERHVERDWTILLSNDVRPFVTQLQKLDNEALPTFYRNVTCHFRYSTFDWSKRLTDFLNDIGGWKCPTYSSPGDGAAPW